MKDFGLLLNVAAPICAAVILVRAGCVVNRMHWRCCFPLMLAYAALALSAFAVMLTPFYGAEAAAIGYPFFIISVAGVIMFDRRLRHRSEI